MAETQIATANWSGFYNGTPWLNQENFRKFFGVKFTSGTEYPEMVDGEWKYALQPHYSNDGTLKFDSGLVFANGFEAQFNIETTTSVTGNDMKFFFVRLDPINKTAAIMSKDVTENDIPNAFTNPFWQCQSRYDVPLCIAAYSGRTFFDLRRFIVSPEERWSGQAFFDIVLNADMAEFSGIYGNAYYSHTEGSFTYNSIKPFGGYNYKVTVTATNPGDRVDVFPIPICSNEPIVVTIINNKNTDITVHLGSGTHARNRFLWGSDWENNSKTLGALSQMTFVLQQAYFDGWYCYWTITSPSTTGGSVDPEQIYTKSEVNQLVAGKADADDVYDKTTSDSRYATRADFYNKESIDEMLDAKANNSDVNRELALKADASDLDDKADASDVYDKSTMDIRLANKANVGDVYPRTDTYSKVQTDALIIGSPVTFYVDADNGDDRGDGTESFPFKTIQHAVDMLPSNKLTHFIRPAAGLYDEKGLTISGKNVYITPTSTRLVEIYSDTNHSAAVYAVDGANVWFDGTFKFNTEGNGIVVNGAFLNIKDKGEIYRPQIVYGEYEVNGNNWNAVMVEAGGRFVSGDISVSTHAYEAVGFYAKSGGYICVKTAIFENNVNNITCFYADHGGFIQYSSITIGAPSTPWVVNGSGVVNPASDTYSNAQINNMLSLKANATDVYTKTEVYTKSETDSLVDDLSDNVYTKTEVDDEIADINTEITKIETRPTYYVDFRDGDDENGDGTQANPFGSLQKAVDMIPEFGVGRGTIYLMPRDIWVGGDWTAVISHKVITIYCENDGTASMPKLSIGDGANVIIRGNFVFSCAANGRAITVTDSKFRWSPYHSLSETEKLIIHAPASLNEQTGNYFWSGKAIIATNSDVVIAGVMNITCESEVAYCEGGKAVSAMENSSVFIKKAEFSFNNGLCFESDGSTIMYGTLTKKTGMTTSTKANGGVVRTGSGN